MSDLIAVIESMPEAERKGALAVLDHFTRPMTSGEIAARLRGGGISQARAGRIAAAVAGWHIVALVGPGGA